MGAAVENVECDNSVILTAPFLRELADAAWVQRTEARFAALGATVHPVWVYCDADSMLSYLRHRAAARTPTSWPTGPDTSRPSTWTTDPAHRTS